MENLGQSLAFCLKYWSLMNPLVRKNEEEQKVVLKHFLKQDQEMAQKVAEFARQQALDFLRACEAEMRNHFDQFCKLKICKSYDPKGEEQIKNDWNLAIWPKEGPWGLYIAIDSQERSAYLSLSFWVRYQRRRERLEEILEGIEKQAIGPRELVVGRKIPIDIRDSFDVSKMPLIKEVRDILEPITKNHIEEMKKIR